MHDFADQVAQLCSQKVNDHNDCPPLQEWCGVLVKEEWYGRYQAKVESQILEFEVRV